MFLKQAAKQQHESATDDRLMIIHVYKGQREEEKDIHIGQSMMNMIKHES